VTCVLKAPLSGIARRPSTAKFIATKFARHFVADDPARALVARLDGLSHKPDGGLRALTTALVDSEEVWQAHLIRVRPAASPLTVNEGGPVGLVTVRIRWFAFGIRTRCDDTLLFIHQD
jgi:hypothetical protein